MLLLLIAVCALGAIYAATLRVRSKSSVSPVHLGAQASLIVVSMVFGLGGCGSASNGGSSADSSTQRAGDPAPADVVDPKNVETYISRGIKADAGLYGPGVDVACPADVPAEVDSEFTCVVRAYGHRYPLGLTVTSSTADAYEYDYQQGVYYDNVGPAHLSCGELRRENGWDKAGLQQVRSTGTEDRSLSEAELAKLGGKVFRAACAGARSGFHPTPDDLQAAAAAAGL